MLLEADLNGANKTFFGSRMVSHLESTKQLLEELYTRRETEAIEVALNKTLLSDISRQTKTNLAIAGADVAYCYDCVAYPFASHACHKVGMPKNITKSFFKTIQDMEMYLRTGHGDSPNSFWDPLQKFQGLL